MTSPCRPRPPRCWAAPCSSTPPRPTPASSSAPASAASCPAAFSLSRVHAAELGIGEGPPDSKPVQLTLEEAFFLGHDCGWLLPQIRGPNGLRTLSSTEAWEAFQQQQPSFAATYLAYRHLRLKNWVIRPGMQYGAHFVAYRHHPAFVHSDYVVLVKCESKESRLDTWVDVLAMSRLANTVAKGLLVLYVVQSVGSQADTSDLERSLREWTVEEMQLRRWLPEKNRVATWASSTPRSSNPSTSATTTPQSDLAKRHEEAKT
eukprot:SM000172S03071  [mRNA]  locus=s172:138069:139609:- [translate_table: standard]